MAYQTAQMVKMSMKTVYCVQISSVSAKMAHNGLNINIYVMVAKNVQMVLMKVNVHILQQMRQFCHVLEMVLATIPMDTVTPELGNVSAMKIT